MSARRSNRPAHPGLTSRSLHDSTSEVPPPRRHPSFASARNRCASAKRCHTGRMGLALVGLGFGVVLEVRGQCLSQRPKESGASEKGIGREAVAGRRWSVRVHPIGRTSTSPGIGTPGGANRPRSAALVRLDRRSAGGHAQGPFATSGQDLAKNLWPAVPDHSLTIVDRGFSRFTAWSGTPIVPPASRS